MAKSKRRSSEVRGEAGEERVTGRKKPITLTIIEERERMQEAMDLAVKIPVSPQKSDNVTNPEGSSKRVHTEVPRSRTKDSTPVKPPMSFSALIKDAIVKSPNQRLLLHEIYESIIREHPYFKTAGEGWKNSVRHNLSINSMFCKIPRAILDGSKGTKPTHALEEASKGKKKGCYWILRDMTSLAEERYNRYDDRRRKSLSTLFARTGGASSQGNSIRIMPFTHVPNVMDIGRRYSDSYLTSSQENPMSVSLEQLRRMPNFQSQAKQMHGSGAKSFYCPEIQDGDGNSTLVEIQPLSIETPTAGLEMPWFATSPQLNLFDQSYSYSGATPPTFSDWINQEPDRDVQPHIQRASRVGPGTLPRRPIKDIWLSDRSLTPTHSPKKQAPSQFRY